MTLEELLQHDNTSVRECVEHILALRERVGTELTEDEYRELVADATAIEQIDRDMLADKEYTKLVEVFNFIKGAALALL